MKPKRRPKYFDSMQKAWTAFIDNSTEKPYPIRPMLTCICVGGRSAEKTYITTKYPENGDEA